MGMNANIICIGKFDQEVANCLEYQQDYYEGTKIGTIVAAHLLYCQTTDESRLLAKALGCEVWDFNTHTVLEENIDWDALHKEYEERQVDNFGALLNAGFICIYMPNG